MLYASIGDDASGCNAQRLMLAGVILRLDVSRLPGQGSGPPPKADITPAGNPFGGPTEDARLIWCYGLRNPFRAQPDLASGRLYIGDVGSAREEEVDEARTGGENFGWPWFEGTRANSSCPLPAPAHVPPIARYDRTSMPSASIVAFPRYRNRLGGAWNFGSAYEGNVFYSDYYGGFLRRIVESGGSWSPAPPAPGQPNANDWATGLGRPTDAQMGPDGALYYTDHGSGSLKRIRFNALLPAIVAAATARINEPYPLRCRRNAGDPILLAIGVITVPPIPLPGFYGRLEIIPAPVVSGVADPGGNFDVVLPVPPPALGLVVHFQCAALAGGDGFLSARHQVTIVP